MSQERADATLALVDERASTTSTPRRATARPSCCVAPWMQHHRGDFFLATKTGERS